jgi:hypothetical protein
MLLKHGNECSRKKRKGEKEISLSKAFRLLRITGCNIATSNMGFAIFYHLSSGGGGFPFILQSGNTTCHLPCQYREGGDSLSVKGMFK